MHRVLPLLLTLLLLLQGGCFTLRYLSRQGIDQFLLLRSRRKVSDVLADPATPPLLRERLQLAMEARRFGIEELGLRGGAEFTRFIDTGGPVAYNLTAAYRTRLKAREWTFPLVGRVPYLGFFTREAALAEARRLEAAGYDTFIRPVGAYSALGYLLSPIYADMIDDPGPRGELRTVETILHEMAHTTAWIGSASDLNESFATVVGNRGAALFYQRRGRPLPGDGQAQEAPGEVERQARLFATWLRGVFQRLQALYDRAEREGWPLGELLRRRDEAFAEIQQEYRRSFPPPRYERLAQGPINNAVLLSFGVYHLGSTDAKTKQRGRQRLQEDLLESVDGDLRRYIALYRRAQERPDGAAWLRRLADDYRRSGELAGR